MASQTDYAWAAGFFDGEGCVSMRRSTDLRNYGMEIIIAQKDIRPVERFRDIFGYMRKIGRIFRTSHKREYFRFCLCGEEAADALQKMLPYLALKREVAQTALEMQESIRRTPNGKEPRIPVEELELRKSLFEYGKWLNTGRWAAATTKRDGLAVTQVSDSLISRDDKAGESAEMADRQN